MRTFTVNEFAHRPIFGTRCATPKLHVITLFKEHRVILLTTRICLARLRIYLCRYSTSERRLSAARAGLSGCTGVRSNLARRLSSNEIFSLNTKLLLSTAQLHLDHHSGHPLHSTLTSVHLPSRSIPPSCRREMWIVSLAPRHWSFVVKRLRANERVSQKLRSPSWACPASWSTS